MCCAYRRIIILNFFRSYIRVGYANYVECVVQKVLCICIKICAVYMRLDINMNFIHRVIRLLYISYG